MSVIVIGAGASGLVAAITAKESGEEVTLLEKNEKVGAKLLMTGNGHCNMAHTNISADDYYDDNDKENSLAKSVLEQFSFDDFTSFFNKIGIITKNENGYIYPNSMQASSVVNALRNYAEKIGVKIKTNNKVKAIIKNDSTYSVDCGYKYECDKLIIATGGLSYTDISTPTNIFNSLKDMDFKVTDLKPALTALVCESNITSASGVRVDCTITLEDMGLSESGQLQITDYGISGIPVFNISRFVDENDIISIDFASDYTVQSLKDQFQSISNKNCYELLCSLLNDKLANLFINEIDLKKDSEVTSEVLDKIVSTIKDYKVKVLKRRGFDFAQVTQGGVSTESIDVKTLESLNNKNLYLCGEAIDIDSKCGGYNLFFAWATGYIAGQSK